MGHSIYYIAFDSISQLINKYIFRLRSYLRDLELKTVNEVDTDPLNL